MYSESTSCRQVSIGMLLAPHVESTAAVTKHMNACKTRHDVSVGDFPDVNRYRDILEAYDLSSFPQFTKVNQRLSFALQQGG